MAKDAERDPTDALSRASMFPVRSLPVPTGPPESEREPAPSSVFAGEDFLFHLYRGSELLQDNCVEQAKEELEQALKLQPRDSEGQGLLGIVYFRLGMYPRAIEIYEELIRAWPNEITPKVNLSLCYLKTGQQHQARDVLEDVIRREPHHVRAWGYYGLALERLGDYAKAQAAFEKANQPHLALRMQRLAEEAGGNAEQRDGEQQHDEVRRAAADAVQELDTHAELPFAQADDRSELEPVRSTRWRAMEPGEEPFPPASRTPRGTPLAMRLGTATVPSMQVEIADAAPPSVRPQAAAVEPPPAGVIVTPSALVAALALATPDARERVVLRGSVALVRSEVGFAIRNDALRAVQPDAAPFARGA
ncbi:MAG TPA: tetratricopeptide repeat protein, partial [Polyangiaceae bacterium]